MAKVNVATADMQHYQQSVVPGNDSHNINEVFSNINNNTNDIRDGKRRRRVCPKRKKVTLACVYCRRSHMTCDEGMCFMINHKSIIADLSKLERPCRRCVKRNISHLCHDEYRPIISDPHPSQPSSPGVNTPETNTTNGPPLPHSIHTVLPDSTFLSPRRSMTGSATVSLDNKAHPLGPAPMSTLQNSDNNVAPQMLQSLVSLEMLPSFANVSNSSFINSGLVMAQMPFASEHTINEFTVMSDFLEHFDTPSFIPDQSSLAKSVSPTRIMESFSNANVDTSKRHLSTTIIVDSTLGEESNNVSKNNDAPFSPVQIPTILDEQSMLTTSNSSNCVTRDRIQEIINTKYESGFLKLYNYAQGYARLQKHLDNHMSPEPARRVLTAINSFRPAFSVVAEQLTEDDLIVCEESFERLLFDYDHLFSAIGIPACLWRRTGEIYKANRQFAELVNIPLVAFKDGAICIYELLGEESNVNYWEKYGAIAFDAGQKAVLTSCTLRTDYIYIYPTRIKHLSTSQSTRPLSQCKPSSEIITTTLLKQNTRSFNEQEEQSSQTRLTIGKNDEQTICCCFSFTIRRNQYNVPNMIVGNFLPIPRQV